MNDRLGQQLGNYRLLRLLGRGGQASVYLGEHLYLKSQAALKVRHAVLTDEEQTVFLQEAQTLVRLSHPHIVRVLDFALQDGMPFLVMEYAPHGTLRQRHPRGTRLPLDVILPYVHQVASALQYTHDQGLIHRDVKPENMLLNTHDQVLLSDFGLVMLAPHLLASNATEPMEQALAGTTSYLAPEEVQGKAQAASDQYALGVVVYEWLCGKPPFQGPFLEVAVKLVSASPPSLREQVPDLSPAIEEVVLRALAKEPEQRFARVQDFATALEHTSKPAVSPRLTPVLAPEHGAETGPRKSSMRTLPSGTVTLLFTDIEGSTHLLEQLGERYATILLDCHHLLRAAFHEHRGHEVDTQGDAFFVAFARAADAIAAAVVAQRAIATHRWPEGVTVRVRMGLHTGEPSRIAGGYVGLDVHYAARIMSAGHGGQVLLSQTTRDLVEHDLPGGVSLRDLGEHRLKDIGHKSRLFQLVIAGLPADFPPLKTLDSRPNNLPLLLSSFIGREREIAEVKQALLSHRLLTLTGTGGCGKTRLSLEVAAGLVEEFEDHVWLVGLVALSEPSLVPQSVASTLGLREQPERALTETITDFLRLRRALLVLDNCEHLIHACAMLAQILLATCPHLHILATSREAFGVPGETVWPVPPLAFPDPRHLPPLESLKQYDAIHLFMDRTADVLPSFVLTSQNAPVVAQVCQRLDGIPLAIELAAARMRVLSVGQLAARLDSSFHLLTGGSRTALPRQQTLRATIDWSYGLLSEREQALFHRLSVFAGGFTLEAAEAICAGEKREQHAVLELLSSLVNKSMVVVIERGDEARYRLLETTRQYAWEKLTASGEVEGIRLNHAHFFQRLAEMAEPEIKSADRRFWLERLDREHDNLRTALMWLKEHGEVERALHLAAALTWFWYFRGHISEARQWLAGTLAFREASGRTPGRAKALFAAGVMAWVQGEYAKAYAHLDESVAIWREVKDRQDLAYSLTWLGVVTELQGDHTAARVLQEESLAVFREVGDTWGLALALDQLGYTMRVQRDYARARSLFEESRALFREVGDKWGLSNTLQGLGAVAYRQGNDAQACSLLEEALALRREVGNRWQLAQSLNTLGVVVQHQGDYGRACVLFEESLGLYWEVGDMQGVISSLRYLGEIAQYQGDYEQATRLFQERLLLSRQIGHKRRIIECLEELARVAEAQGYFIRALQLFGATDALLTPISARVLPADRTGYDRNVAAIRTQLPAEVYTATWAEGQAMTMEQAIEYALTESAKSDLTAPRPMAADLTTKPTALVEEKAGPALRIFAFGPGRVYRGEYALTTSDWIYSKVRELLFYLLCSPSRTKEQIGLALWPDASPAQLRSNLHNTLYHLRHILSRPEWIVFEHNNYTFNRQLPYWFDVEAFESHLAGARQLQVKAPAQAIQALEEAVKLYQGDFLEDMVTGDWPLVRRDALRRMYLEALLALGQLCFAEGRYAKATEAYRQAIAYDSYQEVAHRELMRCYVRQGERGQALRHYQSLLEWMRDELGSPPAPETTALYERLRQGKDD